MDLKDCHKSTVKGLKSLIESMGDILRSQPAKKWHCGNHRYIQPSFLEILLNQGSSIFFNENI